MQEVEQGLVHDWNDVQLEFRQPDAAPRSSNADGNNVLPRFCSACGEIVAGPRQVYCSNLMRAAREPIANAID